MSADTRPAETKPRWRTTPSRKRPDWLVVIGPYDAAFIDDLKASIPGFDRKWDDGLKAWLVHEDRFARLREVIARHSEATS